MAESKVVNPMVQDERARSRMLLAIRAVFVLLLAAAVMLAILKGGAGSGKDKDSFVLLFVQYWWIPLVVAMILGSGAIALDTLTPRKKLSGVTGIFFGLIAGLLATVAISFVIDLVVETNDQLKVEPFNRIIMGIKAAFALTLCYLGVSVVYATQDEFRLVIPYVEFSKQIRGTRPLVLDTSAIIDGRFNDVAATGFISAPIVIPRFVILELQTLSDSADRLKRVRGRRGLDMVRKMQNNPMLDLSITDEDFPGVGVDQKLLAFSQQHKAHLVTTDFNLNKVASIHDVIVLNVNDLANALKPVAIPGENVRIEIIKLGEGEDQGVGYLDDGTMVVVEHAAREVGTVIDCVVTSSIQTSAGRMIFADADGFNLKDARDVVAVQPSAQNIPQLQDRDSTISTSSPTSADTENGAATDVQQSEPMPSSAKASTSSKDDDEAEQIKSNLQERATHGQGRVSSTQQHPKPRVSRSKRNPRR